MSVLLPPEPIKEADKLVNIISDTSIQNETKCPSDDFLQFLHFNLSYMVDLYLENDKKYDPHFYTNAESIFESNCDDIKIMMSTDEQLLNIVFNFLESKSKHSSCIVRGRYCRVLGQLLLRSDIDYTSHISKFKNQIVSFNYKTEFRSCGGILFFMLLVDNIHYLPFFDLLFDIIKSHTYSALTFFEENFFTQILLNKLAITNPKSRVSSLYSPITFIENNPHSEEEENNYSTNSNNIINTKCNDGAENNDNTETTNINNEINNQVNDNSHFIDTINNNVFKILLYLTCNLSRNSSLVTPLLKKETILALLDSAMYEEKLHILSAFQLLVNLHKQSNQSSRDAIEAINGRLPEICKCIMKINSEYQADKTKEPSETLSTGKVKQYIKSVDISMITLFVSIVNDLYGVAGESIPEPINYKMKKSVHLSDSLELFNIRQKASILNKGVSRSQDSYVIENQYDIGEEEEEEEEENEWNYGETDNVESEKEGEIEQPMTLNEFQRKRYAPLIDTISEDDVQNQLQQSQPQVQVQIDPEKIAAGNSEVVSDDPLSKSKDKRKNIPHIPNFSSATHSHLRKPRHSTSVLTCNDINRTSHSGSNSGRIYKKKFDCSGFKNAEVINVSKGFTAASGCGKISIKRSLPNIKNYFNNANNNAPNNKNGWKVEAGNQIPLLHIPKNEEDKFEFTPTSSSSSSSRYDFSKVEVPPGGLNQISEDNTNYNLQTIQQIHQQIQYNYSFSDRRIIHAPESEISPVSKNPDTGENLSLMEIASQAPSNPQIDLIFHHRTKSCNSIDYNNNDISIASDYSFSNDPIEEDNISLLDLVNSDDFRKNQNAPPMYNGNFGAPPVSDLYPLLQSTPVFFNSALSPREEDRETESSPSLHSHSCRCDANTNPMEALFNTPKKVHSAANSLNSTASVSYSNSSDPDASVNANTNLLPSPLPTAISTPVAPSAITNSNSSSSASLNLNLNLNKGVPSAVSADNSPISKNQLTSLNLQSLNLNNTINDSLDNNGATKAGGNFSISSGLNNRPRRSLTALSSGFNYINNYNNAPRLSELNLNETVNNNFSQKSMFDNLSCNYQYPNSARAQRPNFLADSCFTIQEDPDENSMTTESTNVKSCNDEYEKNNKEEEEEAEEEEEEEVGIEEDEESEAEDESQASSKEAETEEASTAKSKIMTTIKEEDTNELSTINEDEEDEFKSPENTKTVCNININNTDFVHIHPYNSDDRFKKDKKNKNDQNHIVLNVKKRSKLIIKTACFLIDQFFEYPYNSFLHNVVIDLIRTFFRFTHLTVYIFNRTKILHRIIDIYDSEKSINLPFSGHIHKLVEIAQKLNLRMSKYITKKKRSKPKEFQIFEECDEWKDYLKNVFDFEAEIMKKDYGGFYSELYLVMKDTKERVLRPDL